MDSDLKLFLVTFLWKVIPVALWVVYILLWNDWLSPKWRRFVDRQWDRLYVAYWRRQGMAVTAPAPRRAQD